tara:strand:- start:53 stop:586 length:534 start_codon:yes stop_codon:yes gene_type:complete
MNKTQIKKKPAVVSKWTADFYNHKSYASTKKELLERCANEIKKTEEEGRGWTLAHEWVTQRTWWPQVLIINREYENHVNKFCKTLKGYSLHWADSAGTRSVFWYGPKFASNYDRAKDLPVEVFENLKKYFDDLKIEVPLILRREDPGVGIFIPEIDQPVMEKGEIPDGVMVLTGGEN